MSKKTRSKDLYCLRMAETALKHTIQKKSGYISNGMVYLHQPNGDVISFPSRADKPRVEWFDDVNLLRNRVTAELKDEAHYQLDLFNKITDALKHVDNTFTEDKTALALSRQGSALMRIVNNL